MILTTIDGVPLYSTLEEALQWAINRGLTGYHTHQYQGETGYMGGFDHSNARNASRTTTPSRSSRPSSSNY
tara:strand:+ start:600 stop:812 length:213 start_codon:yes stop_codon:yes gene_type:complete